MRLSSTHRSTFGLLPVAFACVLWAWGNTARAEPAATPNIVLIFIDDMGYGDIGPFGSTKNRTPNLDRMAREGMKFTSFYAAPVCSVSRAQVITGCYGQRVSLPGVLAPASRAGINAEEHTVAELLKAQGYATMCIGKWHLGDQPEFLPTRHGFDHYFGLPYSNDMQRKSTATGQPVVPLVRDEKAIELLAGDDQNRLVERYTDEAVKFIETNRQRKFFLYLPHSAVHTPLHPGDAFRGKSKNGTYGDWVEEVDWSVGRVLDTLRKHKLERNTLVMFSSDNGPWLIRGADGGEAGPLRGGKGTTWEGGVREPTLAWWPGTVAAGAVCDAVAGNIDFLPTFVSLAGGALPTDKKIDGRDFSALLRGTSKQSAREAHYYYHGYRLEAVRVGPWKLALHPQASGKQPKGAVEADTASGVRLYNLDTDIGETTNVAAQHPDVVTRLQALAKQLAAELGDGAAGPGVRPAGMVEDATLLYPGDAPEKKAKPKGAREVAKSITKMAIGDTLPGDAAPAIAGRAFTIRCEVEPKKPAGVVVAHGGATMGYALHYQDGKLAFTVHANNQPAKTIVAEAAPAGRVAVEAHLAADGAMTLRLNGKLAAQGSAGGIITSQPRESFCVGHDDRIPVGAYDGKVKFDGSIEKLAIEVEKPAR